MSWTKRLIGPAVTVLATLIYHLAVVRIEIIPPEAALLWPFVILAGFAGGVRSGLLAAAWVSGYAWLALVPTGEFPRAAIITVGTLVGTYLVGYRTRQLRCANAELERALRAEKAARLQAEHNQAARNFVEGLNGNIELLQRAVNFLQSQIGVIDELLEQWNELSKVDLRNRVRITRDDLRNLRHQLVQLLTAAEG